jgi:hypothetical protein
LTSNGEYGIMIIVNEKEVNTMNTTVAIIVIVANTITVVFSILTMLRK